VAIYVLMELSSLCCLYRCMH